MSEVFVTVFREEGVEDSFSQEYDELLEASGIQKKNSVFPLLTTRMGNIINAICKGSVEAEMYHGFLPKECLEIIARNKETKQFDVILVRYDQESTDPFLVGLIYRTEEARRSKHNWQTNAFLLAQWGPEKFDEQKLAKTAYNRFIVEEESRLRNQIKEAKKSALDGELGLQDLEFTAKSRFGSNGTVRLSQSYEDF